MHPRAVEQMLKDGIERGKVRGFDLHAVAFLGYLISHAAYHRGEIGVTLTQADIHRTSRQHTGLGSGISDEH